MTELLLLLAGAIAGAAIGGGLVAWLAFRRGAFKPQITLAITGHPQAPIDQAQKPSDACVIVNPHITVSWEVIHAAAAGAGMTVIPKELAPPLH